MNSFSLFFLLYCGFSVSGQNMEISERKLHSLNCPSLDRYANKFGLEVEEALEHQFTENCEKIAAYNQLFNMGLEPYYLGRNNMLEQNVSEAIEKRCKLVMPPKVRSLPKKSGPSYLPPAPKEKCWKYLMSEVRDQGSCGSCWAFSVVAVIEAAIQRYGGDTIVGAEQMLIDCDENNFGCDGGWPTIGLEFIMENGLSSGYEYEYRDGMGRCKVNRYNKVVDPWVFINVLELPCENREENMKRYIYQYGPMAAIIHISDSIFFYSGGVYFDDACPKDDGNHAVVIVGYGVDPVYGPYWQVRNSWSIYWGEYGYVKIARGRNTCGIASTYLMVAELN